MRNWALATAMAVLAGCGQSERPADEPIRPAIPAALTFDGGDAVGAAKIAHGERLATLLDCTGCHGPNLQGKDLGSPKDGAMYAPNVTLLMAQYSDAEFHRLLRAGVPKDRRELWYMPVESYQFLSDADVGALTAFLRTVAPAGKPTPPFEKNRALQKEIAGGLIGNAQVQLAKYRKEQPPELGEQHAWGRYVTRNSCTGCHNGALQGWPDFSPNLDIAGAYSKPELIHLLTTGEGKVKKDLGPMTAVVKSNLSRMTPREREAVADYVLARANRPQ